jgi:hypothetical protein
VAQFDGTSRVCPKMRGFKNVSARFSHIDFS